jgi:type IV fimbrial biogenesis protein FimT
VTFVSYRGANPASPAGAHATGSAQRAARRNPLANHAERLQNAPVMTSPSLRTAGFTLIELMIAVTVMAILIGIAAPSFTAWVTTVRVTGQANDLFSDLLLARSEAVKRDVQVTVCASKGGTDCDGADWSLGWVVIVDADGDGKKDNNNDASLLKRAEKLTGDSVLTRTDAGGTSGMGRIGFGPTGVPVGTVGGLNGGTVLKLCPPARFIADPTKDLAGRTINVSPTGRSFVVKTTC